VSDDSWAFDWLVGFFYSDDQIRSVNTQAVDELYGSVVRVSNDQTTTSYALFANVEWPLAERWSLTGGIRLTTEEKRRYTVSEDLNPYGTSVLNPTDGPFVYVIDDTTIDDDDVSGHVGLTYHPTDEAMVYASVSRGFKSGGFKGNISFNAFQVGPYDPEELLAYEIGFKSMLLGNSLMFNAAAYYYDWRDFQAYSLVQLEIPVVVLTNAGDAEVKGVEAELVWRPTENLELGAGMNWMNGEIVEFNALEGGQDNTGKQLSNSPDRTFSAIGRYNFLGISESLDAYIQATATYQSEVFFEIQNNPVNSESEYWLANLQVGFTTEDEKWDVSLWARNLFDKAYIAEARYVDLRVFPNANTYGEPRSVGISVNYRY
jgi:iron complex outermembrane receptor protein